MGIYERIRVAAKKCPFCGGDDIRAESADMFDDMEMVTVGFECAGCGAELRSDLLRDPDGNLIYSYEGAFENALEKWNRRA